MLAIEMTPHDDAEACAAAPPALFVDLQEHAVECDGVVACDDTLFLMAEDLVEVVRADRDEGARGISRGTAEGGVVIGHEALLEMAIGGDEGRDARDPQLVHEAILQRAVGAFTAAARLGREADDVLDAEAGEGATDLGEAPAIGTRARGGRVDGPARAIGVEGAGDAVRLEHDAQRREDRLETLAALHQTRVEQALGRIVDDGDEGVVGARDEREPAMATAIKVHELAETGARPATP